MRTCGIPSCINYGEPWDTEHHSVCPYCHCSEDELQIAFKVARDANDELIKSGEKIRAQCNLFYGDDNKIYDFDLTEQNKEVIAQDLKKLAVVKGAKGYILIFDSTTIKENKKTKTVLKGKCVIRTLYTPTRRWSEYVWYNENKILGKDVVQERTLLKDEFDAWNTGNVDVHFGAAKSKKVRDYNVWRKD